MRLLADCAGLSVSYVSKIEAGQGENITVATLTALASALSVPPGLLFDAASGIAPAPALPAYLHDAAGILTDVDWMALRLTVEHMATLRRAR